MVSLTNSGPDGAPTADPSCVATKLSKRCEYGIKAAVRLARAHGTGYLQSREIAATENLPGKFLESILLALRSGGILISKVGAGGGYRLAREPSEIKLPEIAAALATDNGENGTTSEPTCGQHAIDFVNERLAGAYRSALGHITLSDLVERASRDGGSEREQSSVGAVAS